MQTVLVTGAAGGIGARLRQLLKGVYRELRLSDIKQPSDLGPDETFIAADLASLAVSPADWLVGSGAAGCPPQAVSRSSPGIRIASSRRT